MSAATQIHRVTIFKVPNPDNVQFILDKYADLQQRATKDGKPYMLTCTASPTIPDARNQGYTIVAQTKFASLDDMKYYDEECDAHKDLKASAKGMVEPPPLVLYMDA